uniref:Uncharacterized protein n=1 Tax=Cacopsylla melanoneura TaxID=428564 RepID=A0A8D9ACM8_9HEMI
MLKKNKLHWQLQIYNRAGKSKQPFLPEVINFYLTIRSAIRSRAFTVLYRSPNTMFTSKMTYETRHSREVHFQRNKVTFNTIVTKQIKYAHKLTVKQRVGKKETNKRQN